MKHLIICVLFCLASCSSTEQDSIQPDTKIISTLHLGDSYTIGTSVESAFNFPNQLNDTLSLKNAFAVETNIIAKNGWTTSDLLDGIEKQSLFNQSYDLVTLLIGVNNQYQNLNFSIFKNELDALIDKAIALSIKGKEGVIILSIPDYSVTPFVLDEQKEQVQREIEEYNYYLNSIADKLGILFINITTISQQASNDMTLLASDRLHPSKKMYSKWVTEMIDQVEEVLK